MRRCATLEIVRLLQGHTQTLCPHHHRNPSGNQSLQLTMDPTPDQPTATVSLGGDCACGCVCVCVEICAKSTEWVRDDCRHVVNYQCWLEAFQLFCTGGTLLHYSLDTWVAVAGRRARRSVYVLHLCVMTGRMITEEIILVTCGKMAKRNIKKYIDFCSIYSVGFPAVCDSKGWSWLQIRLT